MKAAMCVLMTAEDLQEKFREAVKVRGSQSDLARLLGITRQHLNDVLAGRKFPSKNLRKKLGIFRVADQKEWQYGAVVLEMDVHEVIPPIDMIPANAVN